MTWIDAAVLVIIGLSAAFSMVRGFVREVLGVFAWIGAALAAVKFYPLVQPEIGSLLPASMKNFVVYGAMAVVFLIVLIILSLISALIGGLVRDSALSGLDRSLGLVFGAVRGAVVICLAYVALSVGVAQPQWPAPVVNARFLPVAYQGAKTIVSLLPKLYQPKVDPLPGAPAPSASALMQQPVAGSAL
ncbi:MAG: CvpA family protein [Acidocella sp.]|nr:CvpA family protein [Acidocella sp.]